MGHLRHAALVLALSVALSPALQAGFDEADDQYQYLVGLTEKGLHDVAVREARTFLRKYARHPKAQLTRYRLATSLFELERHAEAATELRQLVGGEGFEFEGEVLFRLGQCELFADRPREAGAAFERVLALDKDYLKLPARYFLADARFRLEQFEQAEKAYLAVLAEGGEQGEYARDASYGSAWCAFRLMRYEQAIERCSRFLERWAGDELAGEMRFVSGEALLASGRAADAIAAYGKVRAGPFHEASLRGAAFALSDQGNHRAAAKQFEQLLKLYGDGRYAQEAALHCGVEWMRAKESARALAALRDRRVGSGPEALYWRSQAELENGDARAALESVDAALRAKPDPELSDRLHVARGTALSALGRPEEAAKSFARSQSEYALYAAALEAFNAQQSEDAIRLAKALLERHPESEYAADTRLVLAEALFSEGRFESAERVFAKVVDAKPEPALAARALGRRAWCRWELKDPRAAAVHFSQAIKRDPSGPEVPEARFMLGRCFEAAGDGGAAAKAWRDYVERHPDGTWRAQALLGLARLEGDQGGIERLELLLAEAPDSELAPQATFELAELLAQADRREAARERYQELIDRFPKSELAPQARYGVAWSHYQAQDFAAAARALDGFDKLRGPTDELREAALELLVWSRAKSGDARGTVAAFAQFSRVSGDEQRALGAARLAIAAVAEQGQVREAQALISSLLEKVESRAVAASLLVEYAWLALDLEQLDQAEESVRAALEIARAAQDSAPNPALAEACFFVAEGRFEAADYERAAELYRIASSVAPGEGEWAPRSLYKEGFCHLNLGHEADAARSFARLVEEHPACELWGEGLFLLGEAHYRAGRFEDAASAMQRLLRDAPRHETVHKALFRLGLAQAELERWAECEAALSRLLREAPEFENGVEAELWRGRALAARRNGRGARQAFERVIALDRGVLAARARIELGRMSRVDGDVEQGLSHFLKVAVLYAHEAEVSEALYLAGQCLEELGQAQQAAAQYEEILERYPKSGPAADARARLRELERK